MITTINGNSLSVFEYDTIGIVLLNQPFGAVALLDGTSATAKLTEVLEMMIQVETQFVSDLFKAGKELETQRVLIRDIKALSQGLGYGCKFPNVTPVAAEKLYAMFKKDYEEVLAARGDVEHLLTLAIGFDKDQEALWGTEEFFNAFTLHPRETPESFNDLSMVVMVVDPNGVITITDIQEPLSEPRFSKAL